MQNPKISIIIVLYNSAPVFKSALGAINRSSYDNLELILIDNASDSRIDQSEIDCGFPWQLIRLEENLGFGQGCNYGVDKSTGEYLLFLNPDARVERDTIGILSDVLMNDEKVAAVGPQLLSPDGAMMPSYRFTPDFGRLLFSRKSPLTNLRIFSKLRDRYIGPPLKELVEVEVIPATAMLVRKDAFLKVGGFDSRFFMYAEDFDLCATLRKKGFKICHQPLARVYHDWGKGSEADIRILEIEHGKSIYRFYRKHYPNNIIRASILWCLLKGNMLMLEITKKEGRYDG